MGSSVTVMSAFFERLARIEYEHPVAASVVAFGSVIVLDGFIGGFSGLSGVLVLSALFRIWGMRRPDGFLRRFMQDRYGWED